MKTKRARDQKFSFEQTSIRIFDKNFKWGKNLYIALEKYDIHVDQAGSKQDYFVNILDNLREGSWRSETWNDCCFIMKQQSFHSFEAFIISDHSLMDDSAVQNAIGEVKCSIFFWDNCHLQKCSAN